MWCQTCYTSMEFLMICLNATYLNNVLVCIPKDKVANLRPLSIRKILENNQMLKHPLVQTGILSGLCWLVIQVDCYDIVLRQNERAIKKIYAEFHLFCGGLIEPMLPRNDKWVDICKCSIEKHAWTLFYVFRKLRI